MVCGEGGNLFSACDGCEWSGKRGKELDYVWNVMAHVQKPDLVFRRNGRAHLNRQGASVQSTTGSRGVRISGSNAGYTMFRSSVKGTGYPTPFASFPFTSSPVRHRVPSHFNWTLPPRMKLCWKWYLLWWIYVKSGISYGENTRKVVSPMVKIRESGISYGENTWKVVSPVVKIRESGISYGENTWKVVSRMVKIVKSGISYGENTWKVVSPMVKIRESGISYGENTWKWYFLWWKYVKSAASYNETTLKLEPTLAKLR